MRVIDFKILTGILLFVFLSSTRAETNDIDISSKRYSVIFSAGWNSLRNGRLNNDYIETWSSSGFLDDKIKTGYGFSTEILYTLSRRISIGAGLIYIAGSSKLDRIVEYAGDDSTRYHDFLKTRIYGPSISMRYRVNTKKIDFSVGIGESFLFGKASRHHTTTREFIGIDVIENDYYSTGIGYQLFCGIGYRLTDLISYNMEAGYRHFITGDLIEKTTELPMRPDYNNVTVPPVNLDYSGPFISAGARLNLF